MLGSKFVAFGARSSVRTTVRHHTLQVSPTFATSAGAVWKPARV
jgi:hypothetical protein